MSNADLPPSSMPPPLTEEFGKNLTQVVPMDTLLDRCATVLGKAAYTYKFPLDQLQFRDLPKLFQESGSTKAFGDWVGSNVPKPGDVAGCLPPLGKREPRER